MKKLIPKLIFIALFAAIMVGGKYVIDHKTYNFRDDVTEGLTKFFISGDTEDLEKIVGLLNTYVDDEEYRKSVQTYSADIVGSWFVYIDNKYYCSLSNKNSCVAQHDQFVALQEKLDILYEFKADDGYTIIVPSSYNNLKQEVGDKIVALTNVINSTSARDPQTIEQIRIKKCSLTNDCESCREGTCTCYYNNPDTGLRETLVCYNKVTQ